MDKLEKLLDKKGINYNVTEDRYLWIDQDHVEKISGSVYVR